MLFFSNVDCRKVKVKPINFSVSSASQKKKRLGYHFFTNGLAFLYITMCNRDDDYKDLIYNQNLSTNNLITHHRKNRLKSNKKEEKWYTHKSIKNKNPSLKLETIGGKKMESNQEENGAKTTHPFHLHGHVTSPRA